MSGRAVFIALASVAALTGGCIEADREPARAPTAQPSTPPPNPPMPPLQQRQDLRQPRGGVADDSV